MMWLLSFLPGFGTFISKMLPSVLDYLNKKVDSDLEKYRVGSVNGKEVSIAVVQSEIARVQAQKEMNMVGMNHPIWWVAWALFVLPVGLYHAMIYFVSTFHLVLVVDRVPPVQEQWGMWIVGSIFGAQVTTGIVSQITNAWVKKA
jgi:hypothetical protein